MKLGSTPSQSRFKVHALIHSGHPLSAENISQRNWSLHQKDSLAKWHLGLYLKKEDLLTNRERAAWKRALRLDGRSERQKGVHWSSRWAKSGEVNWNWILQGLKGHNEDFFGLSVLSRVRLFVTPWTVARQAPLSKGILQARILEWVALAFSRGSSWARDQTQVSCIAGGFFTSWATREALLVFTSTQMRMHQKVVGG